MNEYDGIPMGLGLALAQNPAAMKYFSSLDSAGQRDIVEHTHSIASSAEMRRYVQSLASLNSGLY